MTSEERASAGASIEAYRQETLVLSLSANPLNLLMWAHYASNHCGVVLGIDWKAAALEVDSHTHGRVTYSDIRLHGPYHSEYSRLLQQTAFRPRNRALAMGLGSGSAAFHRSTGSAFALA